MTIARARNARIRRSYALAIVLAAALVWREPASAALERQGRGWTEWLDAVNSHVAGRLDDAATRVAPWSLNDLGPALEGVRQAPGSPTTRPLDEQLAIVQRALTLHADVAILHRVPTGYDLPGGTGGVTLFEDGRAVGQMSRTIHWEFARRLLERLPEGDARLDVARLFYRATAAVLQLWGEYPELTAHFSAARDLLGDDPVLLLYEGTMRQAFAGARMQRFFDEQRRARSRDRSARLARRYEQADAAPITVLPEVLASLPSARESRGAAERLFRRALTRDPNLAEARIRLAHVLGDAGRHEEASAELTRARSGELPRVLDYYASLLTGREARALGQFGAARAAFDRAATLYPNASAPEHGLSELAIAQGDRAEAVARVSAAATRVGPIDDEPWLWLERAHVPSVEELVTEMRTRFAP